MGGAVAFGHRRVIALLVAVGLPLIALLATQIALEATGFPSATSAASAAHVVAEASPGTTTAPATGTTTGAARHTAAPEGTAAAESGASASSSAGTAASAETAASAGTAASPTSGAASSTVTPASTTATAAAGATYTELVTLASGRSYDLHTTVQAGQRRPLVILLHAYLHDAAAMRDLSGATPYSDEHGFVLAYGHAIDGAWNSGTCCAGVNGVDDVAYLRELVADVERRTPVDPTRVYVWGYSNGGMMAARSVCEAPDVFAAAGVVAGALLVPCQQAPIRMMHIHGTQDTTVPWRGGWSDYVKVTFPDSRTESSRVTSSSVVVGVPWDGGHDWPWWATGKLWEFSSQQRLASQQAVDGDADDALPGTP
ncbi:PHB depolymerase family esterase [Parafrankia sp. EUN1f]|uniref:alpha/beta hydrolase family esterase n=1 Tax=Parafrankia sp. EUN1f TaxID=102897 RepID=UPI001E5DDADA|nr:PHB depolymerase family esterase [Parafrankia sp. EUN1f]